MALLTEEKLQQMERVHARVLRDLPDDLIALTMRDAVETIRAAWAERDEAREQVRQLREEIGRLRNEYAGAPAFGSIVRKLTGILAETRKRACDG